MEKSKPCPFCGSNEFSWEDHNEDCYLKMMENMEMLNIEYTPIQMIDAWNRRS